MKKIFTTFAAIFQIIAVLTSLTACDEGDIRQRDVTYAQGGFTVKMTGRLTGISQWDDGLMVVLAAFDGQDRVYDMGEMRITSDCEGRDTTLVWSNLNRNARNVELCVVNKLRRRMATLKSIDLDADADTVTMEVGDMDAGLYAAVQGLFDQRCAGCHGGGNYANLKLNRENAITQLVNVPASREEFQGAMRVKPSNPDASALYQMLDPADQRGSSVLMFQHKAAFTEDEMSQGYALDIIRRWIKAIDH